MAWGWLQPHGTSSICFPGATAQWEEGSGLESHFPRAGAMGVGSQQCPAWGAGLVVSARNPFPVSLFWEPC